MRLTRFILLGAATLLAAACDSDSITEADLPPVAEVRFINAVADTGGVDIRMIDQVDLSPVGNNLLFRAGTLYQQGEAKARRIRVFPTSINPSVTSQILLDTTITLQADTRVTLLLTGAARTVGGLRFVMIDDKAPAPPAGEISVRMVNASTGAASGYLVATTTTALPGTATFGNVAPLATSPYVNRAVGAAALRVTETGATVTASVAGPATPAAITGAFPAAGVSTAGTAFSAYYFPKARAGTVATPGVVWFVDRNPCDAGC